MAQQFDTATKSLFRAEGNALIPLLVRGADLISTLNVEVLPPPMRTDRTYHVTYNSGPHVLHFEYQADSDADMVYRLLIYCALLLREHKLPVICVVIYLFRSSLPEELLKFDIDGEEWLHFRFIVIALWKLDARTFVERQDICIYPLLPAMDHANAMLLLQAIDEMVQYYQGAELTDRLLWFSVFLRRTDTISVQDKLQVKERLQMFEELLEQDEWVREKIEKGVQKGVQQGIQQGFQQGIQQGFQQGIQQGIQQGVQQGIQQGFQQGELKILRGLIFDWIKIHYPALKELAEQQVLCTTQINLLQQALFQILQASSEETVHDILTALTTISPSQQAFNIYTNPERHLA